MAKLVSKTYGDALFELALEEGKIDSFLEEAKAVSDILLENDSLVKLLNHPKIGKEEKIQVVEEIFKKNMSAEFTGFLVLMVKKDRQKELLSVLHYFIAKVKEYKKIGIAYVTSAVELDAALQKKVEEKLLDTTEYEKFEMHYDVDEELIGGMVIRIGDRIVDSSIKTKLTELSKSLTKIQLA